MDIKKFLSYILFCLVFISCNNKESQFYVIQGEAQGSTYSIKYISKNELVSKTQIDSLLLVFDLSLSTYRKDSKISKINNGDSTLVLDDFFIETFKKSQQIYK